MNTVILNSTNLVENNNNNILRHTFPTAVTFDKGAKLAIGTVSVYNCFFNITSALGNNSFLYTFCNETQRLVLQDGFYSIADLNTAIAFQMQLNNHYLSDSTNNYFYFEIKSNPTYYGIDIVFYNIPTAPEQSSLNLTKPGGATWTDPIVAQPISITIDNDFYKILGIPKGTYNSYQLSTLTPQINPLQNLMLRCNIVNHTMSYPSDVCLSIPVNNTEFGADLAYNSSQLFWNKITPGVFSHLEITIQDQNFNDILIRDTDMSIMILIDNNEN